MKIQVWLSGSQSQIGQLTQALRAADVRLLEVPEQERSGSAISAEVTPEQLAVVSANLSPQKANTHQTPYPLAMRRVGQLTTEVAVGDVSFGRGGFVVIGGPCAVESYDQLRACADIVKSAGASVLRGGAFKPRSSPYAFQGLGVDGLKILKRVSGETGMPTVSEVLTAEQVEVAANHVDILQIGARSMQNYPLLREAGRSKKPVLLKRGMAATLDELLMAAEYVLSQGNAKVILCERGGSPHANGYTRNCLDLAAVPVLRELTHLPIIVDPSHATGVARYVPPMAKAAVAAGADGVMIEMHTNPVEALCDGLQALTPVEFTSLVAQLTHLSDSLRSPTQTATSHKNGRSPRPDQLSIRSKKLRMGDIKDASS